MNMSTRNKSFKKIVFICLVFVFGAGKPAFSDALKVRVPIEPYPPFFVKTEAGQWQGLSIELADALLGEAGLDPVYTPLPFKRALLYLESGSLDMMLNLTVTPERAEYINFIGPQLDETVVLVVLKNSDFTIASLEDIKKLPRPISVELGKVYGKAFEEKRATDDVFARKVTVVRQTSSNEKMLQTGRTSGFLGYGYHIFNRFKINPVYSTFKVHPFVVRQDWVHYGFSKKAVSSETLQRIQSAFDRLQQKGALEKIRQRYKIP
jgi:polar amino acid transport system substrate-binding protein